MNILESISSQLEKVTSDFKSSNYLLAVSGGADSMVLLDCFTKLNLNFEVAHYNFQLRGDESDDDEALVRATCEKNGIIFNQKSSDTNAFAKENKLSIQEAARELRYNWFFTLKQERHFDFIITAHHANDTIETFFIHLLRGSGIKGLSGIKNTEKVLRPLLKTERNEIETYAQENNIAYRNDSSNESLKYRRNYIRKKIIPELNQLQENANSAILKSIEYLNQANEYLNKKIEEDVSAILSEKEGYTFINMKSNPLDIVLYYALSQFGFNSTQVHNIQKNKSTVGKKYFSPSHVLLVERETLAIKLIEQTTSENFEINTVGNYKNPISISITNTKKPTSFSDKENTIYVDADKVKFPLIVRKWKNGDRFIPFGMKGKQKLSDYFINEKFSQFEKEKTWLLTCDSQIIWVINHRLDDRYKITPSSTNTLKIVTFP